MRKVLSLLTAALLVVLAVCLLPMTAQAANEGTCGDDITYVYDTATKTLTLTGTGAMYDYTQSSPSPSPFSVSSIKSYCTTIEIGEGITHIGNYAFYRMMKVTSVTLPSTLRSIGKASFSTMSALTDCSLPEGLETIGEQAFMGCKLVPSLTIPSTVTSIGKQAFFNWTLPASLTIPGSVKTIGESAFSGWTALEELTLENGVETIAASAFSSTKLTEVYLPASVISIAPDSFSGSNLLAAYHVDENNTVYCDVDDVLYSKDRSDLVSCPIAFSGDYVVDPACRSINYSAFANCSEVTAITLPDGLESIGSNAFQNTSITEIVVPASVTSMDLSPFSDCYSLTTAVINANVDALPQYMFKSCSSLETVTLGEGVKGYGYGAFSGCSSLTSVTVIPGITEIPTNCFNGCSSLSAFDFPATVTSIGDNAFNGCSALSDVILPDDLTYLGNYAFYQCSSLTEMTIPEGVTTLKGFVFYECSSIQEITVLGDITQSETNPVIEMCAFYRCSALERIYFKCPAPDKKTIYSNAFNNVPKSLEIHYLNIYPQWATTKPLDVGGNQFTYVKDVISSEVEMIGVELRPRPENDSKRDIRFIAMVTPFEGSTIVSRSAKISRSDHEGFKIIDCPLTFHINEDGTVIFTVVITGVEPKYFDVDLTVTALLEVTGTWDGTFASIALTENVQELENKN